MRSSPTSFIPATIVACVGSFALWSATDGFGAFTAEAARRLHVEREKVEVPKFELTNFAGGPVLLPDGKVALVEFIYTTCPTICQTAGDDFFRLRRRLQSAGLEKQVQMLSVSFDLARDDNESLASYAEYHGADGNTWTVARPRADALPSILRTFGVTVIRDELGGFQHNTAIHVLDRQGRLVAITDTGDIERAATIAESLM